MQLTAANVERRSIASC